MCYTVLVIVRDSSDGVGHTALALIGVSGFDHGCRLGSLICFALYLVKPITRLSGYILLCGRWISPSPLFIIYISY